MLKNLVKEEDFNSFLSNNRDKLILVKFFTTWCSPCQDLQENIVKLEKEKRDLIVLEVDAEKFSVLSQSFNVLSVPTLFLFRPVEKKSGSMSIEELKMWMYGEAR